MYTNSRGCPGWADAKRGWKSSYIRKSWTPSKNASGLSGHPHCQRQSRDRGWLMLLGLTPTLSSLPQTVPHMRGLLPGSETHVRKHWPWWGMPTNGPCQQQHCYKKRWRGWALPTAAGAWAAVNTLAATDILVVANAEDPSPWHIKEEIPRWCHTVGTLLEGGLSLLAFLAKAACNLCQERSPHHLRIPRKACWDRWSPPVAPANLVGWKGTEWWDWLVKTQGRWRGRLRVSTTAGAPSPGAPWWRGSSQCWGALWSRVLSFAPYRLDTMACLLSRNADLVERTAGGPQQ